DAPTEPVAREQFCRFARNVMAHVPAMSAIVIWNEANTPRYWPVSAGARAYEALLARCWDVLHAARPTVNVVDSTASHYDPDGFQTVVPPFFDWAFDGLYTGRENDRTVLPAFGLRRSQSSQLTAAISLAYCQPAVSAFFNFELIDETRLVGWQSGLLYANGIRKPSFGAYREIAAAASSA